MLENQLDVIENKGMFAGKAYYESLMNNEQERIKQLESEYYALEEAMNEALASGAIEENSEALQDMQSELNSVEQSWAECTNQLLEYKNQMREMDWSAFEKTIDYLSDIKDESEFIRDLMSVNENDLFVKKTGRLSDSGLASGALMAQNYDVNMGLAEKYRDKIEEIGMDVIASAWLSELERISGNQFLFGICVRHNDTNHPHCHLVLLNLDPDMRSLNSFQLSKLARICAQTVTERYGLTVAKGTSKVHLEHQLQQENNDISKDFDGITVNSYSSNSSSTVHFGIGGVGVIGSDGGYDDDDDDDEDDTTGKKKKKKRRRRKL